MKRVVLHIAGLLCLLCCQARQLVFSPVDTSCGLSDNYVFAMTQMHDGRLVVVTGKGVNVWDGREFRFVTRNNEEATPLPGYNGAAHLYVDAENRLWVKDYQRVWCYDGQLNKVADCLPEGADDVYIDDRGETFFIRQDTTDTLFDLKTLHGRQYRFYGSGTVRCFEQGKELYAAHAPNLDSVARTSLVITDTLRSRFYQHIDGVLCLEFDTETRQWTELFRSQKLHTLAMTDKNTVMVVGHQGMWKIDLRSRKAEQMEQMPLVDGTYISSSRINTVFTDQAGNVWLGTYDRGLLRGEWQKAWYQSAWFMGLCIALLAALPIALFLLRNRPRTEAKPAPAPCESRPATRQDDFTLRVTRIVEQNLAEQGYGVQQLAADLCMERTGLYKKMVAATGKTPTAFIRSIRLNHAAQLIREGKLTMTEIAHRTGFSSSSYMARCFQEDWGKKTSEIRES